MVICILGVGAGWALSGGSWSCDSVIDSDWTLSCIGMILSFCLSSTMLCKLTKGETLSSSELITSCVITLITSVGGGAVMVAVGRPVCSVCGVRVCLI